MRNYKLVCDTQKFVKELLPHDNVGGVPVEIEDNLADGTKVILPWTVTKAFFADNPNKTDVKDKILKLMGIQASGDLGRLAVRGDVDLKNDPLLCAMDGARKLGYGRGESVLKIGDVSVTSKPDREKGEVYYFMHMKVKLVKNV